MGCVDISLPTEHNASTSQPSLLTLANLAVQAVSDCFHSRLAPQAKCVFTHSTNTVTLHGQYNGATVTRQWHCSDVAVATLYLTAPMALACSMWVGSVVHLAVAYHL